MKTDCKEKLQQEREKLNQMIEDALNRGVAIADDEEIQKQSRLVERLMENAKLCRERSWPFRVDSQ
jgi:F0F1-type ATP synthase membrane subunit b/b'